MHSEDDSQEVLPATAGSDKASKPTRPSFSSAAPTITDPADVIADSSADNQAARLVGSIIDGRYAIERTLGRGGMGQVFLAKDLQLHSRPVVVKLLLDEAYRDPYRRLKFQQEMEALSRIQHPGVIGIIDSGELPGARPFIVMEYIDGGNLRSQIKPEGMHLERAGEIIKQVGRALAVAHEKGILHRDLKPENIMLQNLGHGEELVKIIDFGIAKIKDSAIAPTTATTATAGTIAYMAPEQLSARPVSLAADIYSLGIIAYEMVTGRRPFNPESPFELLEMQRAGVRVQPIDLRPSLPTRAQHLILKALSFDPDERQRGVRELTDELARALLDDQHDEAEDSKEHFLQPTVPTNDRAAVATAGAVVVPTEANQRTTVEHLTGPPPAAPPTTPRVQFSLNTSWLKISVGLFSFLIVGSALYGVMISTRFRQPATRSEMSTNTNTAAAQPQSSISYWLTVQKMRDGKPYEAPFRSSGQEIFENGYGFRLNVSSNRPGYLYVFNEGATDSGDMSFTILYPTPRTNNGSPRISGDTTIETNWNRFGGQAGTEEFWMIWSAAPVPELEAARELALASEKGKVTNAAILKSVREFLIKHSDPKPDVTKDKLKQETIVRGTGDIVVQLVELEHR